MSTADESGRINELSEKIIKLAADVEVIQARLGTTLGEKATAAKLAVGSVAAATRSAVGSAYDTTKTAANAAVGSAYDATIGRAANAVNEAERHRQFSETEKKQILNGIKTRDEQKKEFNDKKLPARLELNRQAAEDTIANYNRVHQGNIKIDSDEGKNILKKYGAYEFLTAAESPDKLHEGYYIKGKLWGHSAYGGTRRKRRQSQRQKQRQRRTRK